MWGTSWVAAVGGGCWLPGRPRRGGLWARLAPPQPVTPKECVSEEWNFSKGTKQRLVTPQKEVLTWGGLLRRPCLLRKRPELLVLGCAVTSAQADPRILGNYNWWVENSPRTGSDWKEQPG